MPTISLVGKGVETVAMRRRDVMAALSGLLLAMYVSMLSSTVVTNALPQIVSDLQGTQSGYTWVVVSTLLTMTASTPVWGKLADIVSKKVLVQTALTLFTFGSLVAAAAPNMIVLVGGRAIQGLGVGGLAALTQVIIATMVPSRERARYTGYVGVVFAAATVTGPLVGGLVVDSPIGWRGCFIVGLPVTAVAFVLIQSRMRLPVVRSEVHIDYLGATLIVSGVSLLLIFVSLAGSSFSWSSSTSTLLVTGGLAILAAAWFVEARVATDPLIPLRLFKDRTTTLSIAASVMVGVAMFGVSVYPSQYFQLSRGLTPTEAGLMSIFMVIGLIGSSVATGRLVSRSGRWKRSVQVGLALVLVSFSLLGTIDEATPLVLVGLYLTGAGVGLGASMQTLLLAVQNVTRQDDLGAASSAVIFFRSLGGSIGVSVLGALLSSRVARDVEIGGAVLPPRGADVPGEGRPTGSIPDLDALSQPWRELYEQAFGNSTALVFLVSVPFAIIAFVCVVFIKEIPLRSSLDPVVESGGRLQSGHDESR